MASPRKRRYNRIGHSPLRQWNDTEESRRRSEEDLYSRVVEKRRRTNQGGGACQEREHEPLGYKALEDICNSSSSEDGIWNLANKSKRFEALLNSKSDIRPDLMKLIIRAIHMCCSSDRVTEHAEQMLRLVFKSKFLYHHLSKFINQMPFNSPLDGEFQSDEVISHLSETFLELLERFGREIVDTVPFGLLNDAFEELKSKSLLREGDTLSKKILRVKDLKDEIIRRKTKSVQNQDESELEPPENFRQLSVIPHSADVNIQCKPFLRVNVVDGSYKDLEHYLDVQFRLLREDFIIPLRDGIKQLRANYGRLVANSTRGNKLVKDVHVYHNVTILYPVCNGKGMVYRIRFGREHGSMRHVKWDKTKLLKFGSLLCLSADDFYELLFATVENREPSDLRRGELEVRFEGVQLEKLNQCIQDKEKFDMVESPAFFEAYRHVLEGLQEIQPDRLPFQEHIVKCIREVGPPGYEEKTNGFFVMRGVADLNWNSESHNSDLVPAGDESMPEDDSVTLDDNSATLIGVDPYSDVSSVASVDSDSSHDLLPEGAVNIYDLPFNRDSLGFNDSQMCAFKMALTKKIAVIQGPPGTGKTYVGQKIARVLLQSALLWQDDGHRSPILMVSHTNHALDDFLKGQPREGKIVLQYRYD